MRVVTFSYALFRSRSKSESLVSISTTAGTDDVATNYKANIVISVAEKSHAISVCVEADIKRPR